MSSFAVIKQRVEQYLRSGAVDVAVSLASTLGVTGVLTATGGLAGTGPQKVWNHPATGALASRGTDAARTAGTIYYSEIAFPCNMTLTGLGVLNGTTVGTDKIAVALYSAAGVKLVQSAAAGATTSGADTYQQVAFESTLAVKGPGVRYFAAVQINGTTDGLQFMTTTGPLTITGSQAGSFGTFAAISSVATTHTDNAGPLVYAY
jgi:hypothetical protein